MKRRFFCGHLVINKDDGMRQVLSKGGGGARYCPISHIDMGFEEIHDRLREIFLPGRPNCNSKLYDFQCKELDTNRYTTFYEYIHKNSLTFKSTLLYLCTPQDDDGSVNPPSFEKLTTTQRIQNLGPIIKIPHIEAGSSTQPIVIKTDDIHESITDYSSTNFSIDPTLSTFFSSSPSSSPSRHHSERDSRERRQASLVSPHQSSRKSTEDDNNELYSLFKDVLNSLDHLLDVLYQQRFTSFYSFVEPSIDKIKSCRLTLKLSDYRSLYDAEQLIISIQNCLTNRINSEYDYAPPHELNQQVDYLFNKTSDLIRHLLSSIRHLLSSFSDYQSQIDELKQSKTTYQSLVIKTKPIIKNSYQQKTRIEDNDESSEASNSEIEEERLEEVARDSIEQRLNSSK